MPFLKIAHRGAAGTRPELTRAAFFRAMEIGVDMIELDVQLTRDRELVVLHDRKLGRTINGVGAVRERSLVELQSFDVGSWFDAVYADQRVPTLAEVLEWTHERTRLNVEIKSPEPDWEETARAVVALLQRHGRLADTIVSCFAIGALESVRKVSDEVRLGVLWQTADFGEAWAAARDLGAVAFHPMWGLAEPPVVEVAHERGLQVIVWTVNEPDDMRNLVRRGVDGIISDYPERFATLAE